MVRGRAALFFPSSPSPLGRVISGQWGQSVPLPVSAAAPPVVQRGMLAVVVFVVLVVPVCVLLLPLPVPLSLPALVAGAGALRLHLVRRELPWRRLPRARAAAPVAAGRPGPRPRPVGYCSFGSLPASAPIGGRRPRRAGATVPVRPRARAGPRARASVAASVASGVRGARVGAAVGAGAGAGSAGGEGVRPGSGS